MFTVGLRFVVAKRVTVSADSLNIGRAKLPASILGTVEVIAKEDQFFVRGALADSRAFFALKSGLPGLLRVEIRDKQDPTPYALIATRHPAELAAAISELLARQA